MRADRDEDTMRVGRRSRAASLHALLVTGMVSFGLAACHGCHDAGTSTRAVPPVTGTSPTLRVYFVSDLAGAIEPCGCVKDQLGGLDHAAAWIDAQKPNAPSSVLVAVGPTFFMDPVLEPDHRTQDVAKAEALASSLAHLGLAAWAPATNDWAAGSAELSKLAGAVGVPGLLANVRADAGVPLLPTRIVTANGLHVAFIGVGVPPKDPALALVSPEDAVREAAQAARAGGANVVIALASVGRGEAKRIADAVPDLTAVIVGDSSERGEANTPSPPGEEVGKVLIAEAANHLQTVGALDLYVRDGSYVFADAAGLGEAQKLTELTRRIDELHSRISNWERDKSIAPVDLLARRTDLARLEAERAGLSV
jgi:2',3'-cyclic-nucleotide 2'-phosphodiesterase (5'-nucleotidase family)